MSYLRLRISVYYTLIQINNQPVPSTDFNSECMCLFGFCLSACFWRRLRIKSPFFPSPQLLPRLFVMVVKCQTCSYIFVTSNCKLELKQRSNRCCCSCLTWRHVFSSFMGVKGLHQHFNWGSSSTWKLRWAVFVFLQNMACVCFVYFNFSTSWVEQNIFLYSDWHDNTVCHLTRVESIC